MNELIDIIKSSQTHNKLDMISPFKKYLQNYQQNDVQILIDCYFPQKDIVTQLQWLQVLRVINDMCDKIQERNRINTSFYINSLITVDGTNIIQQKIQNINQIDIHSQFKDILGVDYYKKLINYGLHGLINQKFQQKIHNKYSFFHWIQNKIQIPLYQEDSRPLQLLKHVWSFKVNDTLQTMKVIKLQDPQDQQINSLQIGLSIIGEIYSIIIQNQQLKQVFIDRKHFDIRFVQGHSNKIQQKQFNAKIYQIKQKLYFVANYFKFTKNSFKNPFYLAIAQFLSNKEDNYLKQLSQPIMNIPQISFPDKFFYAKKFYRSQDFQRLRQYLNQKINQFNTLDYILLFGSKKQSQIILQNYIDQTNDIQKAAIVCVYLLIFLQQSNIGRKDTKIAFYINLIKQYQYLLSTLDSGIARHKFDKKRIAIQVQRKRKTMNKTFNFNCLNCKNSQCLQSISKRIAIDSKHRQVKMKGNTIYSKDIRNQVMHCMDCMFLLPKCAICLFPVTVFSGYAQQIKKSFPNQKITNGGQCIDNAIVWCPKCFHGGHLSHVMKWNQRFQRRCPVYTCKCKCSL